MRRLPHVMRVMRVMRVIALLPALGSMVALAISCRQKRVSNETPAPSSGASGNASSTSSPSLQLGAARELRGWYLVQAGPSDGDGSHRIGAGWWFSSDALRIVWSDGRDRQTIVTTEKQGDVLHLVTEQGAIDVTRTDAEGVLLKLAGEALPLRLRAATDDEVRVMEKLDAVFLAKSGDACARATKCCQAARQKELASEADCASITSTPELSRCVRTLERLRKSAASSGQSLPECGATP